MRSQPLFDWQHNRIVLIKRRARDPRQSVYTREFMHKAQHISTQFCRTGPRLKRKRRLPHQPEIRFEKMLAKNIVYAFRA